ncbi:hypothetical protein ACHAPT_003948 [Fusarium lateritium]
MAAALLRSLGRPLGLFSSARAHIATLSTAATMPNFPALDLINKVDTWPYYQRDASAYRQHMADYYYFFVASVEQPLGYVHRDSVHGMTFPPDIWDLDHEKRFLTLASKTGNVSERTRQLDATLKKNFDEGRVVQQWHNELHAVYDRDRQHVVDMDVSGIDIFGVVSYGVHLTGYVRSTDANGAQVYKYWVPRRSQTQPTFPGMLDNFVAGNIRSDESPLETMIRKAFIEMQLPEDFIRANIRPCGTVTYQMAETNDGRRGCQHHCQFVFELEFPEDVVPRPNDGEVKDLKLMSLREVQEALSSHDFTPNRILTYIAHFVRHGIINDDNEPRLMEVCSRLHRKHDLFIV